MNQNYSVFKDHSLIHQGSLDEVLTRAHAWVQAGGAQPLLFFRHQDGAQLDFPLHLSLQELLDSQNTPQEAPGPGRPKLGVQSREVTLLPKHWEWLERQGAKASGTLRKLVEAAMAQEEATGKGRCWAAARILTSLGGDLPQSEEALRRLYAGDAQGVFPLAQAWPTGVSQVLRQVLES